MNYENKPSKIRQLKLLFGDRPDLLTDPVFLIGNGKSRENFDLERLRGKGTIIGCNALYRDFAPDILVAIDAKMLNEISSTDYSENNFLVVPHNRHAKLKNAKIFKTEAFNTSGCFAMKLISFAMKPKECYMIGMDSYKGNVYDATPNYAKTTLQNFNGVKSYYLKVLNVDKCQTTFINVNTEDAWGSTAEKTGKYKFMPFEDFEKILEKL